MNTSRIHNPWPIARDGLPFIAAAAGLTALTALLGWFVPALVLGALTIFVTCFFRDPERVADAPHNAVLSPADGRVLKVEHLEGSDNPLSGPCTKVSIFMSVFNVHVNRIPAAGTVLETHYRPGKFFSANLDKASLENERNTLLLDTPSRQRIAVIQIAGLVARRIACWVNQGDACSAGQRFGLIRFGSRLEVYLPPQTPVIVLVGESVKAGQTVIAYLS